MAGDVISGVVLGIGAPNRTRDGRAVQCGIVLSDDHGLCRIFADYDGAMDRISLWDRVSARVHVHAADQRAESWKLDDANVTGKVCDSLEKRSILNACVLRCGNCDPIDFLDHSRRSIGVVRPVQVGMGYGMEVRDYDDSPDWVMTQSETPQKPYLSWASEAGKSHRHQICAHEGYEWLRRNQSRTSQLFDNMRITDIDWDKWLVVGNTKDRRNVWVVVHVHRLKKTTELPTLAGFSIADGRPSGWPYLQHEEIAARRVASTGQQLLFTT